VLVALNRLDHYVGRAEHQRLARHGARTGRGGTGTRGGRGQSPAWRLDDGREPERQGRREIAIDAQANDGQDEQQNQPQRRTHHQIAIVRIWNWDLGSGNWELGTGIWDVGSRSWGWDRLVHGMLLMAT